MLDHDNNFYLISLSILITCLMDNERILLVVVVLCVYLTDHLCGALHCFHVFFDFSAGILKVRFKN